MIKILRIETIHKLKDPLTYGFLLIPLFVFFALTFVFDDIYSYSGTLFIQSILVSFFIYGNRRIGYRNESIQKKLKSSKVSEYKVIFTLGMITSIFYLISILSPTIIVLATNHSLGWVDKNMYKVFIDDVLLVNNMQQGLNGNYILFTSNFYTFFQFAISLTLLITIGILASEVLIRITKDQTNYFASAISITIVIFMFGDIFVKNIYVLSDGVYTKNNTIVANPFWNTIKKIDPFYWVNKMVMNTVIADTLSGTWIDGNAGVVGAKGIYEVAYFNVFHVGTKLLEGTTSNRPLIFNNINIEQLCTILVPITTTISISMFLTIDTEVNR